MDRHPAEVAVHAAVDGLDSMGWQLIGRRLLQLQPRIEEVDDDL